MASMRTWAYITHPFSENQGEKMEEKAKISFLTLKDTGCVLGIKKTATFDTKWHIKVVWLHGRWTNSFSNFKNGPAGDKWRGSNNHWNSSFLLSQRSHLRYRRQSTMFRFEESIWHSTNQKKLIKIVLFLKYPLLIKCTLIKNHGIIIIYI